MKCKDETERPHVAGATLLEVLVIVVVVVVVLLLILPVANGTKGKSPRVKCTAALKQVALSYNLWAVDHQNAFPFETPASMGGSREYALKGNIVSNVQIVADQLRDPTLLICPSEKKRKPAISFGKLTPANISYFLNADGKMKEPNGIIAGDRDLLTNGIAVPPGLLTITNAEGMSWGKLLHQYSGNIALADGSTHQVTSRALRDLLALGGTNRLIVP